MIDPDSPFASFGAGSTEIEGYGYQQIGRMKCFTCEHEWNTPWDPVRGSGQKRCPKCKSEKLVLKDGSVVKTPPARR